MTEVPCRGCGGPIIWAISPTGARIPLDARAPVYMVQTDQGSTRAVRSTHYVSHFCTCPNASEFSGRSRGKAGS